MPPIEPTPEVLAENDMTKEEFAGLSERDQQNLMADTTAADGDVEGDATAGAPAPAPAAQKWVAVAPTPAPAAPAPSPAPTPAPSPTPAPAPGAPAPAPAAPAPAPETDLEVVLGDKDIDITAPRPMATKEDAAKLVTLKAERTTLFDEFADGKLTKEEYNAKLAPIESSIEDISSNMAADKAAGAMTRQALETRWTQWVEGSFKESKAQGGIDYEAPENADKLTALDANIRRFAQAAPLMHPDKPNVWRDKWALQQGHRATDAQFGIVRTNAPPPPPAAPAPAGAKAPVAGRPAPDMSQLPPTLRGIPPAGDPGIQGDEFAHLDAMPMAQREKAVAMMTPEQEQRYLDR